MRHPRRAFLSGIGAGTAALFGRPLLRACRADGVAPKRVIFFYMPNCNIRANWLPSGGRTPSKATGDATQFTFGKSNDTLAPIRDQLTLVTGLSLENVGGDPHGSGIIRLMTGGTIRAGEKARDPGVGTLGTGNLPLLPSFDQVLLGQSAALKGTQVSSLQLGADTRADDGRTDIHLRVMSYDTNPMPTPLPPEIEPTKTYARLFSGLVPASTNADQMAALERALAQDRSVLDFVQADLSRLNQRLPQAQREKLAQHLDGLREVERSLDSTRAPGASPGATLPGPPPVVKPNVSANHATLVTQYLGVIKLALQFDVTRVISFMFGSGNSQVSMGDFLTGYTKGGLHPIAHQYKADALTAATRWYCGILAAYVQDLAATPDVSGSLLDNTLIAFSSEVGQYHEHDNIPFALMGGKNLGHTGGRCLNYPDRTPADVWVGVARAFGVTMPSFGDKQYSMGELPELLS